MLRAIGTHPGQVFIPVGGCTLAMAVNSPNPAAGADAFRTSILRTPAPRIPSPRTTTEQWYQLCRDIALVNRSECTVGEGPFQTLDVFLRVSGWKALDLPGDVHGWNKPDIVTAWPATAGVECAMWFCRRAIPRSDEFPLDLRIFFFFFSWGGCGDLSPHQTLAHDEASMDSARDELR